MKSILTAPRWPASRQAGVGIVEMMVASLVGAILVIATVQIFTANRQTFRVQDALSVTQETGTFALDFIVRDLLRAGYPGYPHMDVAFDWDNTVDGGGTDNDTLAVIYKLDAEVAGNRLCTGEEIDDPLVQRISNRYFVNDEGQLVCEGFVDKGAGFELTDDALGEQVLVENVESFQVLFGADQVPTTDPTQQAEPACVGAVASTSFPTTYITADDVDDAIADGATPPDCMAIMDELQVVRAVRLALLVRTEGTVDVIVPASKTYTVLDQVIDDSVITPDDGRVRRLFTKTVLLRNVEEIL